MNKARLKRLRSLVGNFVTPLLIIVFGEHVVNPPPQPPKRIVSKAEFVRVHTNHAFRSIQPAFAVLLGLCCACITFLSTCLLLVMLYLSSSLHHGSLLEVGRLLLCLSMSLTFGTAAFKLLNWGLTIYFRIKDEYIDIVPLTRFNASHLPVSESLVRASNEPAQTHQAVLLRAFAKPGEDNSDQLLRAASGEQFQCDIPTEGN